MPDNAFLVDDEGGTDNAELLVAVHFLGLPDAVLLADLTLFIGKQFYSDPFLFPKFRVSQAIVAADAEKHAVLAAEIGLVVGKIRRLQGAAWSACLRIEKK